MNKFKKSVSIQKTNILGIFFIIILLFSCNSEGEEIELNDDTNDDEQEIEIDENTNENVRTHK